MTHEERHKRWYFKLFENLLEGSSSGPIWLRNPKEAEAVAEDLQYRDGQGYDLICYSIMASDLNYPVKSRLA